MFIDVNWSCLIGIINIDNMRVYKFWNFNFPKLMIVQCQASK